MSNLFGEVVLHPIYGQFEEKGWVQSAVGICAFFYM